MSSCNVLLMFQPLFPHDLHPIALLYINGEFPMSLWQFPSSGTLSQPYHGIPYSWFLNQAFINFRTGISELHNITCFGNLQPPFIFLPAMHQFPCNSLSFFLFVCIICHQPSFSIIFPPLPCLFLIFSISLFVLFYLQNMFSCLFSHCSFRIFQ